MTIKTWSIDPTVEGFTLLEMLIAITIVSLAVATIGVSFPRIQGKQELLETVTRLDKTLSEARTIALEKAITTTVTFALDRRQWSLSTKKNQWQEWPETVDISVVSAQELGQGHISQIAFLSDGTSSGAIIQIRAPLANTAVRRVHWLTGAIHAE